MSKWKKEEKLLKRIATYFSVADANAMQHE
jgi:hypothetical protein